MLVCCSGPSVATLCDGTVMGWKPSSFAGVRNLYVAWRVSPVSGSVGQEGGALTHLVAAVARVPMLHLAG